MRIIVIGPSDYTDTNRVAKVLAKLTKPGDILRLKGQMKGVARIAQDWATSGDRENWRKIEVFYLADGKEKAQAEIQREYFMFKGDKKGEKARALICFGLAGRMVAEAKRRGLKTKVIG